MTPKTLLTMAPPAIDPVCGMTVNPAQAAARVDHAGRTYFFCSTHCAAKFKADPAKYLDPSWKPSSAAMHDGAAAPDAEYTCPMHPEIRQKGPGACPICGMALEPVEVSLEEQPDHELLDMT